MGLLQVGLWMTMAPPRPFHGLAMASYLKPVPTLFDTACKDLWSAIISLLGRNKRTGFQEGNKLLKCICSCISIFSFLFDYTHARFSNYACIQDWFMVTSTSRTWCSTLNQRNSRQCWIGRWRVWETSLVTWLSS